jgi:hypothetical protein
VEQGYVVPEDILDTIEMLDIRKVASETKSIQPQEVFAISGTPPPAKNLAQSWNFSRRRAILSGAALSSMRAR